MRCAQRTATFAWPGRRASGSSPLRGRACPTLAAGHHRRACRAAERQRRQCPRDAGAARRLDVVSAKATPSGSRRTHGSLAQGAGPADGHQRRCRRTAGSFELIGDEVVENKILSSRLALAVHGQGQLGAQRPAPADAAAWKACRDCAKDDILRPEALSQMLVGAVDWPPACRASCGWRCRTWSSSTWSRAARGLPRGQRFPDPARTSCRTST